MIHVIYLCMCYTPTVRQAIDADEREKWVRRLEDTILRHASRIRGISDTYCSVYGSANDSAKRPDYLQTLDKRVSEADAYLQLMIEQTTKIEQKIAQQHSQAALPSSAGDTKSNNTSGVGNANGNNSSSSGNSNSAGTSLPSSNAINIAGNPNADQSVVTAAGAASTSNTSSSESHSGGKFDVFAFESNRRIQDNAHAMLDSIKHSIVLLQIAKNTAHPINGIYHGPSGAGGLHMKSGAGRGGDGSGGVVVVGNAGAMGGDPMTFPAGGVGSARSILYGAECMEKDGVVTSSGAVQLFVPETSYSSSEGEEDFFDANDDPYSSQDKTASL